MDVRRARRFAWTCTLLAAAQFATPASADTPPPAEAFASLPGIGFIALSPNGRQLAQDDMKPGQARIVIWDIDTGKTLRVVAIDPSNKLRGISWADDATVLLDASVQKAMPCNASKRCTIEWFRTIAVSLDGSPPHVLLMDSADRQWVTGATILSTRPARPGSVTMETLDYLETRSKQSTGTRIAQTERERSGWTSVAFDVDTRTGKGRPLETGTGFTRQWVVDRGGNPVARSEWVATRGTFTILTKQGNAWREVFRQTNGGRLGLEGVTRDGSAVVAIGAIDDGRSKAWAFPLDGSARSVLYEDPKEDVVDGVFDENTNTVVAVRTGGLEPAIHWFDPERASQHRSLTSAYSGRSVHELGRSIDGQRALLRVESASTPPTYHVVNFARSRSDAVGEAYPALAGAKLGSTRTIRYAARDGTSIPAYLTLPPGSDGKNVPMVVLPHGGPHYRDSGEFDYIVQFLATRGYAVLQPQFRGSTGFGQAFETAGYRQWGGLMQDDVTDGVKHLIADGTANPQKICIVGASYGGYAALAGAAFTPDLYACAASIGGVSDLPLLLIEAKRPFGADTDSVASDEERIGKPSDPQVIARSPARSAATVKAPVLLLHGAEDSVVPVAQSERMAKALQNAGKPVTFVRLPGEDHWLSRADTRLQVLKQLDSFLAQYLR